jgi:hypothetical protein
MAWLLPSLAHISNSIYSTERPHYLELVHDRPGVDFMKFTGED